MVQEHREYNVQNLPLDKMNCIGKNMERTSIATVYGPMSVGVLASLAAVCFSVS